MNWKQILFRIGFVIPSLGATLSSIAQVATKSAPVRPNIANYSTEIALTDKDGRPFKSNYVDVQGSPFYFDDYKVCALYLDGSRKISRILAKLDVVSQEVVLITSNNQEMAIPEGNVKEMDIFDSSAAGSKNKKIKTGFPPIDNQNQNNFYLVYAEGKVTMVKCLLKKIIEIKNDISAENSKSFESYEFYYFFVNNEMKRLKKDKSSVLNLFPDNRQKLEEFASSSNLNFKSSDQLVKLVEYYNSLQ